MPARNTPAVSTSPFAVYAREHGFPKLTELPGSVPKHLSAHPEKVAPNSPSLEELAAFMKVPLADLQAFAKAPPMGDKWVKKIRSQIDSGTLPKGKALGRAVKRAMAKRAQHATPTPRPTGKKRGKYTVGVNTGNAKNPFAKLLLAQGYTLSKLADEIGVRPSMLWKYSSGKGSPNHPVLTKIADVTGASLGQLAATQKGRPMQAGYIEKAAKQFGLRSVAEENIAFLRKAASERHKQPGKAVVLGSIQQRVRTVPSANGKHREAAAVEVSEKAEKRGYNRLRGKTGLQLRQSVRALISTLNVAVMKGDEFMPPIPIPDMYAILRDYMSEKGIKAEVLLDPQFGSLFDPK